MRVKGNLQQHFAVDGKISRVISLLRTRQSSQDVWCHFHHGHAVKIIFFSSSNSIQLSVAKGFRLLLREWYEFSRIFTAKNFITCSPFAHEVRSNESFPNSCVLDDVVVGVHIFYLLYSLFYSCIVG